MAITPNTDFTAGQILTATQQNQFPRGAMGQVTRNSAITALTTTTADISGLSITFTAVTGRLYKATWSFSGQKTTASFVIVAFTTGANSQVASLDISVADAGYYNASGSALFTASSGSVTYKMRGVTGAGTATVTGAANQPAFFMIEDIGLA